MSLDGRTAQRPRTRKAASTSCAPTSCSSASTTLAWVSRCRAAPATRFISAARRLLPTPRPAR
eukprot:10162072-Alexandrium_andersonii.AAC.1